MPDEPSPLPQEALPLCVHCKADPINVSCRECNIGPFRFLIVFCANCRVTISAVLLAVAQPNIAVPQRRPLIIKPS